VSKKAVRNSEAAGFINPSEDAHQKSERLLDRTIRQFRTLENWSAVSYIEEQIEEQLGNNAIQQYRKPAISTTKNIEIY
jgi:hypothetical protein